MTTELDTVTCADALEFLKGLPDESVNCIATSPPYFNLRDYQTPGQIGLEASPREYVAALVAVFHEAKRVLRDDGTFWLNLGDSYANNRGTGSSPLMGDKQKTNSGSHLGRKVVPEGLKDKDLIGIPWMVAFALRDDGWYLRSEIIWDKPNPMPESVTDRPTKAHETVFLFAKTGTYWYDAEAIREPAAESGWSKGGAWDGRDRLNTIGATNRWGGNTRDGSFERTGHRNKRSVWRIATQPTPEAHFATFPEKLIEPMILAGCPVGGVVLDPFFGSGTTGRVARRWGRHFLGCDLNPAYVEMAQRRLARPFSVDMYAQVTT